MKCSKSTNAKIAAEMQKKIVDEVEVTPEEVRQFFNNIQKKNVHYLVQN